VPPAETFALEIPIMPDWKLLPLPLPMEYVVVPVPVPVLVLVEEGWVSEPLPPPQPASASAAADTITIDRNFFMLRSTLNAARRRPGPTIISVDVYTLTDDLGCDEDQQFILVIGAIRILEEIPQDRN
jgi:hypothetical protein